MTVCIFMNFNHNMVQMGLETAGFLIVAVYSADGSLLVVFEGFDKDSADPGRHCR